ncbi:MAG: isochorismatase family protein [Bacteroidales bacterium]|nr:isochorismatase family protein [Bacteroidales bacterium]
MKILALIDPQNDFVDGSLGVGYAKWVTALQYIKGLLQDGGYDKVVMTKDWHPADHCSFAPQGGPWPQHCVEGTPGAEPFWMLKDAADEIILKGRDPQKEEYGVDLLADAKDDNVEIDVVGLCYDYCVANCAKMTSEAHPNAKVRVLAQGCVAIDPTAKPDFGKAEVA